jgi:hypothetical protein
MNSTKEGKEHRYLNRFFFTGIEILDAWFIISMKVE